jgi:hypothetical protein
MFGAMKIFSPSPAANATALGGGCQACRGAHSAFWKIGLFKSIARINQRDTNAARLPAQSKAFALPARCM